MLLNEADKQLILTALDAYGRTLIDSGATQYIVNPVEDLIQRVAEADTDATSHVEKLLALADLADGLDIDEEYDEVEIEWTDKGLASQFVDALTYPSAVMIHELLEKRLICSDDEDVEIDIVTDESNPDIQHELAKVLYGGPITTSKTNVGLLRNGTEEDF